VAEVLQKLEKLKLFSFSTQVLGDVCQSKSQCKFYCLAVNFGPEQQCFLQRFVVQNVSE